MNSKSSRNFGGAALRSPWPRRGLWLAALAVSTAVACYARKDLEPGGGDGSVEPDEPYVPPDLTDCVPLDLSQPIGRLDLAHMFEDSTDLTRPTDMRVLPDGRVFVVSQDGIVWSAPEASPDAELRPWLDLSDQVESRWAPFREEGMLSLAFHPSFEDNGELFVMYSHVTDREFTDTVISRFTVDDPKAGRPEPDSEQELIRVEQPSAVHNGGQLRFGEDGYLYFSLGDGGGARDPQNNGQNLGTLLGAFSRIDVDREQDGKPYGIPPDNPFVDTPGARPEIFAYGFRNAWRFSFHPETGEIWSGDVGQEDYEELNVVVAGGNYGWQVFEGPECLWPDPEHECDLPDYVPPIHAYDPDVGVSITAGVFYQGEALEELSGTFLFSDFVAGTLWQVRGSREAGYEVVSLMQTGLEVSSFSQGPDGEVYLVHWGDAEIYRLEAREGSKSPRWAEKLSETGCFEDLEERSFGDPVVPYAIHMPLWSDGAAKERGLVLPKGGEIDAGRGAHRPWRLPVGTATIKTFLLGDRPIETRFLVQAEEERWLGASYRWNARGTEARLLEGDSALTVDVEGQRWTFPSRADCGKCHTRASQQVLGIRTGQLAGASAEDPDPIEALHEREAFDEAPSNDPFRWPSLDDEDASLNERARAYLASNCAHCHRPGGPTPSALDLRYLTPLADTHACDAEPRDDLGMSDARILSPGEPGRSLLLTRMRATDPKLQMPPLARNLVDEQAADLVERWIEELDGCGD